MLPSVKELRITLEGPYKIRAPYTNTILHTGKAIHNERIIPLEEGLRLGKGKYSLFGIIIQPEAGNGLTIEGITYPGNMFIVRKEDMQLKAINIVDIEDYIKGVLPQEAYSSWPQETLKAQAVAARSFAYYSILNSSSKSYDVSSGVTSQVYGGKSVWQPSTNKAVDSTRGEALVFNDSNLLAGYYHACCGGHTANIKDVWGLDIKPLSGRPSEFCQDTPYYSWKEKISLDAISERFRKRNIDIGSILDVYVDKKDESGRVLVMGFITDKGEFRITGHFFRHLLGTDVLKSTRIILESEDRYLILQGYGWGHGVGLCQWGAKSMAERGFTYKQILDFFYPGSRVERVDPDGA